MGGYRLFLGVFVVMAVALSGCSLLVSEPVSEDMICISKAKLAELNISIDALLEESAPAIELEESDLISGDAVLEPIETDLVPEEDSSEASAQEPVQEPVQEEPEEEPAQEVTSGLVTKTFTEGDLVSLKPKATDADNDVVTFSFSAPLDADGNWQTGAGDAGEYVVTVTASDGKSEVSKTVKIVVLPGNNAPKIAVDDVTVTAGQTVTLMPIVSDADNDEITLSYSGWMTGSTKETTNDDVGTHVVTITASDGKDTAVATATVTVEKLNHAPVIAQLAPVTVQEGELVKVNARATDADGDDVVITYSAPLDNDGKWQTMINDAGTYAITVTASDGKLTDQEGVTVIVNPANTAPEIALGDVEVDVIAGKTATVTLNPVVTDADGDKVTISYTGFMTSNSKVVSEDDEGVHTVTVTADDGKATASVQIKVTVSVNTPPDFTF